jgi:putative transposase
MEATLSAGTIPVPARDMLTQVLRQGAQQMLTQAIESEVAEWIDQHSHIHDEQGRRQVVRNGYLPERKIVTGLGEIEVRQPRVADRRPAGEREPFSSKLAPKKGEDQSRALLWHPTSESQDSRIVFIIF